jgi:hypothetical protein
VASSASPAWESSLLALDRSIDLPSAGSLPSRTSPSKEPEFFSRMRGPALRALLLVLALALVDAAAGRLWWRRTASR